MYSLFTDSIKGETCNLPVYWKQGFFQDSPMLHPEADIHAYGYVADRFSYTMNGDDVINATIIACCLLAMLLFGKTHTFLTEQSHDFLLPPHQKKNQHGTTTAIERVMPILLVLLLSVLGSILFYYYRQHILGTRMPGNTPPYILMLICTGSIISYFVIKQIAYAFINWVFFDKIKRQQWSLATIYILYLETMALFPVALVSMYFSLPPLYVISAAATILISAKLLLLYKTYRIFLPKFCGLLHLLSYLCALEVTPILVLWALMNGIMDTVTI